MPHISRDLEISHPSFSCWTSLTRSLRTSKLLCYASWWQGSPGCPRTSVCPRAQTGHLRSLLPELCGSLATRSCSLSASESLEISPPLHRKAHFVQVCRDHSNTHLTCMIANSDSQLTSESVASRSSKLNSSAIHQLQETLPLCQVLCYCWVPNIRWY